MKQGQLFAQLFIGSVIFMFGHATLHADLSPPDNEPSQEEPAVLKQSASDKDITLLIECPKTLVSGAVNHITVTVRNDGDRPVFFEPVRPQQIGVGLEVVRRGKPVDTTILGKSYFLATGEESGRPPISLQSGQERRFVVNLTRYFDLSLPGEYQVVATWGGFFMDGIEAVGLRTEPVHVEVVVETGEAYYGLGQSGGS